MANETNKAKVIFADSRQLGELLPEKSVDLILTGHPYWNEVIYSDDNSQLSRIDDYPQFLKELAKVWEGCSKVLKDGSIIAIWVHDLIRKDKYIPFHSDIVGTLPEELTLKNIYIWDRYLNKDRGEILGSQLGTRLQYILICQKNGISTQSSKINDGLRKLYWEPIWYKKTTPKLLGSSWLFRLGFNLAKPLSHRLAGLSNKFKLAGFLEDKYVFRDYDTECPQDISDLIIKLFSSPQDTVLDPFVGSGTTLKSAIELNRQGVGIEINKNAVTAINKKLSGMVTFA